MAHINKSSHKDADADGPFDDDYHIIPMDTRQLAVQRANWGQNPPDSFKLAAKRGRKVKPGQRAKIEQNWRCDLERCIPAAVRPRVKTDSGTPVLLSFTHANTAQTTSWWLWSDHFMDELVKLSNLSSGRLDAARRLMYNEVKARQKADKNSAVELLVSDLRKVVQKAKDGEWPKDYRGDPSGGQMRDNVLQSGAQSGAAANSDDDELADVRSDSLEGQGKDCMDRLMDFVEDIPWLNRCQENKAFEFLIQLLADDTGRVPAEKSRRYREGARLLIEHADKEDARLYELGDLLDEEAAAIKERLRSGEEEQQDRADGEQEEIMPDEERKM